MKKDEQQILLGCLKNDAKAQRTLYEQYKVQMFRLCLRYARDRQEAEDLLQEGFITVFKDLKNYRGVGALGGWIRKVMVNNALQHIRKTKHRFQSIDSVQLNEYEEITIDEEDQPRVKELTKYLQSLPDGYRTVFNLYVIEGYTHKEIAKVLSISESTSKSQLFKAKGMLRKLLEKSMIS
ncbi:MAG: RNA polymerase sigma factor [Saprospiraceae bacterium]|nr:RNA polymerase sigma factor [Saprospiraceae bacterium]